MNVDFDIPEGAVKASDLYDIIKGGTQRANPWAGFLQEEIEKYSKNEDGLEYAYDVSDGSRLTRGIIDIYPLNLSSVSPSPPLLSSPIPRQISSPIPVESPVPDTCPEVKAPQWMPYAIYNVGDIVKDKCIIYKVILPVTKSEDNIASPEFSQYFTVYTS
jgi:hypothetical protein